MGFHIEKVTRLRRTANLPSSPAKLLEGRAGTRTRSSGGAQVANETWVVWSFKMKNPHYLLQLIIATEIKCQHNIPEKVPAQVGATGWAVSLGAMQRAQFPASHFLCFFFSLFPSVFFSLPLLLSCFFSDQFDRLYFSRKLFKFSILLPYFLF